MADASALLSLITGPLQAALEKTVGLADALSGGMSQTAAGLAQVGAAASNFAVGLVDGVSGLGAIAGVISQITGSAAGFVEAFSPGVMDAFNDAVRNVNATIGQALAPMMQVFTGVLQQAAAVIDPLMQQLAPVLTKVAQMLGDLLMPALDVAVAVVGALIPVFDALLEVLKPFTAVVKVMAAVFQAAMSALKPVLDAFKSVLMALVPIIQNVLKALYGMWAFLMKLFGGGDIVKQTVANLKKGQEDRGRVQNAAFTDVGIKTLEQIAKDVAVRAAGAGGGVEMAKTQDQFMGEVIDLLDRIADKDLVKIIGDGILSVVGLNGSWKDVGKRFVDAINPF